MNLNSKTNIDLIYASSNILMQKGMKTICQGGGVDTFDQAYSNEQLTDQLLTKKYDVLIFDLCEKDVFDLKSLNSFLREQSGLKILIISNVTNEDSIFNVLDKGVQGFLTYTCDDDEIIHAVFAIAKGEKFYCNKVLDLVLNKHLYQKDESSCAPTNLSARESEIAALIGGGKTNKEVANDLCLSPHTVHTHRKNIMKKLGVRSASELTMSCLRLGIIEA
ncbi:MAG: DNA-binding NarL/FixJ family response regulator [Patiriisocius sp.]|jgi:DNA-binding NarL/FixJ family response regulator